MKAIRVIIALLFSATIIFAATGVAIYEHYCLISEKRDFSFTKFSTCCSVEEEDFPGMETCQLEQPEKCCSIKDENPGVADCCETSLEYVQLEVIAFKNDLQADHVRDVNLKNYCQNRGDYLPFTSFFAISERSPPAYTPAGRELVIACQTFLC